jgi:hypothetical protein
MMEISGILTGTGGSVRGEEEAGKDLGEEIIIGLK